MALHDTVRASSRATERMLGGIFTAIHPGPKRATVGETIAFLFDFVLLFGYSVSLLLRQSSLPEEQQKYLKVRRLMECVEFLTPPHSDKQYGGRSSGSLQWRLSRNECTTEPSRYTWTANSTELNLRRYSIALGAGH